MSSSYPTVMNTRPATTTEKIGLPIIFLFLLAIIGGIIYGIYILNKKPEYVLGASILSVFVSLLIVITIVVGMASIGAWIWKP